MNEDYFWRLIEKSRVLDARERASDEEAAQRQQLETLAQLLEHLFVEDLLGYELLIEKLAHQLYSARLWGAAYLLNRGKMVSDDGFHYFCLWVISLGKRAYQNALIDPDTLHEFVSPAQEPYTLYFEKMHSAGYDACLRQVPNTTHAWWVEALMIRRPILPRKHIQPDFELWTTDRKPDVAKAKRLYPKLWSLFGSMTPWGTAPEPCSIDELLPEGMSLRVLQAHLPWGANGYGPVFEEDRAPHKRYRHSFIHMTTCVGNLGRLINDMDHDPGCVLDPTPTPEKDQQIESIRRADIKALVDLQAFVIDMARTHPTGPIDLFQELKARFGEKFFPTEPKK